MLSKRIVKWTFNLRKDLILRYQRMCENPMGIEKWKALPVILNISLFTALLIIGWKSIDHNQHVLSCSANDKNPVLNHRWHGLEFIKNSIILKQRNRYQQMIQISVSAEKLKTAAPIPYVLLLIILIGACTMCKASCEDQFLSFSGTSEEWKKIFFVLLLICHLSQVTACDRGEYEHNSICCSLCEPGSVVAKHCTVLSGTVCNPCTAGEYIEHPNGLEKCFKCKTCDGDLGLKIKEECTYIRNTKCEPRKGYYCVENCQMANKHTTCPPGHGVKEKGTPIKDTVCEKCPVGTFSGSDSSTEACKNWTVCEKLNLQLVERGNNEADVKCEKINNLKVIIPVIAIVIVLILTAAVVYWKRHGLRSCFTKRPVNGIVRNDRQSPAGNKSNENPSDSTSMPLRRNERP